LQTKIHIHDAYTYCKHILTKATNQRKPPKTTIKQNKQKTHINSPIPCNKPTKLWKSHHLHGFHMAPWRGPLSPVKELLGHGHPPATAVSSQLSNTTLWTQRDIDSCRLFYYDIMMISEMKMMMMMVMMMMRIE
jgi:hypothetical protein